MMEIRFDVLILDLKDDSDVGLEADSNPAGLEIFETLKKTRFVPVVFYTALAHKVRSQQTSFVRVVEKTEGIGRVKEEEIILILFHVLLFVYLVGKMRRKSTPGMPAVV